MIKIKLNSSKQKYLLNKLLENLNLQIDESYHQKYQIWTVT